MCEYILNKPIRSHQDKLNGSTDDGFTLNKTSRDIPARLPDDVTERIKDLCLRSHRALASRDFSLFDFRIDDVTGECYVIEACSFWTFAPISMISTLVEASRYFDTF